MSLTRIEVCCKCKHICCVSKMSTRKHVKYPTKFYKYLMYVEIITFGICLVKYLFYWFASAEFNVVAISKFKITFVDDVFVG